MKWLLSDKEFDQLTQDCPADGWAFEFMLENGIISQSVAEIFFAQAGSEDSDVPDCPSCGAVDYKHYPLKGGRWQCKICRHHFYLKTGRYLDNSKLPITHWWRFCWIIEKGDKSNSCAIARDLGITQKSAWEMISTLKRALKDDGVVLQNSVIPIDNIFTAIRYLMKVDKNIKYKYNEKEK